MGLLCDFLLVLHGLTGAGFGGSYLTKHCCCNLFSDLQRSLDLAFLRIVKCSLVLY